MLRSVIPSGLLGLALLTWALGQGPDPVAAQSRRNPYDAIVRSLERDAVRLGSRPAESGRALPRILRIDRLRDHTTPGVSHDALARLAEHRRLPPHLRVYATTRRGLSEKRRGDVDAYRATFDGLGLVRDWMVIGAFDNEGKGGLDRAYPPEALRNDPVDRAATYSGKEREVRWRRFPPELATRGYISFDAVFRPWVNTCAYAETFVELERARPVTVWLGASGAAKVWFNGDEILADDKYRRADYDRSVAMAAGRRGANRVLVKTCTGEGRWGFILRLGDPSGAPMPNLRVTAEGPTRAAPAPGSPSTLPAPPTPPLANLEALVEAGGDDARGAAGRFDLARVLRWSGAQDEGSTRARELAERAAEIDPTVDHLELAASLAENRAERMRFVSRAEELHPRHPRVVLQRAELLASGPDPGRALRLLVERPLPGADGVEADWLLATLYERRRLKQTGLAIIERNIARTGGSVTWLRRHQQALSRLDRDQAAFDAAERYVALRPNDFDKRKTLIEDARTRGETTEVVAHLEALRLLEPGNVRRRLYEASILEGLGRRDDALEVYAQLLAWAPEESSYHVKRGDALLRFEKPNAALAAFREALALRPQDASVRNRIERLEPAERPDEKRALPSETFLARRTDDTRYPMSVLHDLTVSTVYENGLTHRFHQYVFQVHTDEGARQARTFGVPFEPGAEWVDVRSVKTYRKDGSVLDNYESGDTAIGQAAYRVYYDMRQRVLRFPDLEPGDVVEVRYRVDDVSRRNAFNDYYGNLALLQRTVPVKALERVLVAPRSRELHFNDPAMDGLEHETRAEGDQQIHRFHAEDVPALRAEPDMPGATEVAPYLHVSTYATWAEVGRWWWGLAQDQLRPDDALERTVRELTDDARSVREKVARIYAWVTERTRYVGLEFGIHGFKPYRVTQVVDRGFGDCKDTASLLYAMFQLAGIDARIALVRTSNLGMVEHAPASLAVFNHAIAYVPELDLFLDGTTNTHGMSELPASDQGALTLIVGPNGAELRTTPWLSADDVRHERDLDVRLAADGSAELRGEEVVTGSRAGMLRTRYEAPATRQERLQNSLAQRFAGVEVIEESFDSLDPSRPIRFRYRARAPRVAQRVGDEMRVEVGAFRMQQLARTPTRNYPLMLGPPSTTVERRTLRLPPGHVVSTLPQGGNVASKFGRVAVSYERNDGTVTVSTTVSFARPRVSPEQYQAFRAWIEDADELLREKITIRDGDAS